MGGQSYALVGLSPAKLPGTHYTGYTGGENLTLSTGI